jgi:hypothetical protein
LGGFSIQYDHFVRRQTFSSGPAEPAGRTQAQREDTRDLDQRRALFVLDSKGGMV